MLQYDGTFTVTEKEFPSFGIEFRDLREVTMDIVEAWGIVVDAGFGPEFAWWTLFKPLNPGVENPMFVFPTDTGFALVDSVTGEVVVE